MMDSTTHEIRGKAITIQIPKIEDWTISDLKKCCKKNKVKGYTKMTKYQLVEAVKQIIDNFNKTKEELK
ncbi:hypothetical protein SDC9_120479 [bioreactor metagenome]|uniref:Rho termination factor N-terminal domain-containing protein n=1 Tax=bioreactor metagenome TaxID=1076179 RepID=A0A645C776_9ZZZZ